MSDESPEDTLLEFPCRFPVKAFGDKDSDFENVVFDLIQPHVPELKHSDLTRKYSSSGRYVSVTAQITAHSKAQLDAIYNDLSDHDAVLMAL